MAVETLTLYASYICDGTTISFPFNFPVQQPGDVAATYIDTSGNVTQIAPAGLAVTLNPGDPAPGGTAVFLFNGSPGAAGATIIIRRYVVPTQSVDINAQDNWNPAIVTDEFDRLTMVDQQLTDGVARALCVPPLDPQTGSMTLPPPATRANGVLGFNSAGGVVILPPNDQSSEAVTAFSGKTPALLGQRFNRFLNVIDDFGAYGDGVHDDTLAIQQCHAAVASLGGGTVYYPAGTFLISSNILSNASHVRHVGAGRGGFHDTNPVVNAATKIIWGGANGGTMFTFASPAGGQRLVGWGLEDVALISGVYPYTTAAGYGAVLSSVAHGDLKVTTQEFSTAAIASECAVLLAEQGLFQHNNLDIAARQINQSGTVLQLGGGPAGNSCFNKIWTVAEYSGIGIDLQDCDNNDFYKTYLQAVGTSAQSLMCRGQTVAGGGYARNNIFWSFSQSIEAGAPIFCEGIGTYGSRVVVGPSGPNFIMAFDSANVAENIYLGPGASFYSGNNQHPIGYQDYYISDPFGYRADTAGVYEIWGMTGTLAANSSTVITYPNGLTPPNHLFLGASAMCMGSTPGTGSIDTITNTGFTLHVTTAGVYRWDARAR